MVDFPIIPKRSAFITIDFQNLFVEGHKISAPTALQAIEKTNHLAQHCRDHDIVVIHIAHQLRPDHSNLGVLGEVVPTIKSSRLLTGGEQSADFHPSLDIQETDWVAIKPRLGAFTGSDLELTLRARHIDTLLFAGVATGVCVDTTARQAALLDFKTIMLSDATATSGMAGYSADELQQITLAIFAMNFGEVASVAYAIKKIDGIA